MDLSVVIRTRDMERYLGPLLRSLASQTVQGSELVLVNNYSTERKRQSFRDELVEKVARIFRDRAPSVKLVVLADAEFSHAYSTNLGLAAAENELVCITNAHSLPTSNHWLEVGTRYFEEDKVVGVSGFFIPHQEGAALRKLNKIVYQLTQRAILRQDWCSTINCIIRKSLWQVYPFDENLPNLIPETRKYGLEDYDWSKEMIARGFRIVVDPMFRVFHSHGGVLDETARNLKGYFLYREIQQKINLLKRPRESFSKVFKAKPNELGIDLLC